MKEVSRTHWRSGERTAGMQEVLVRSLRLDKLLDDLLIFVSGIVVTIGTRSYGYHDRES